MIEDDETLHLCRELFFQRNVLAASPMPTAQQNEAACRDAFERVIVETRLRAVLR